MRRSERPTVPDAELPIMHPSAESFAARVRDRYGFDPHVVEFDEGTETAAAAAAAIGCDVSRVANSIAVVADETVVVAVVGGDARVDLEAIADLRGADPDAVGVASPDRVKETLGWGVGGVPPLAHDATVPVVVDPALLDHETVWAGAGAPSAMVELDPDELVAHAEATVAVVSTDG